MISIIIPVYNTEDKKLNQCITSIENQTYKDIEVILVDDGSNQNTARYIDSLTSNRPEFNVVHQTNGGPSKARNAGLELIHGSFFCFVDADDYLSEDYLERLLTVAIREDSDIVFANMILVDEYTGQEREKSKNRYECTIEMSEQNTYNLIQQIMNKIPAELTFKTAPFRCKTDELWTFNVIWGKLYRTTSIGNCRFISDVIYQEDNIFLLDTIVTAMRISFIQDSYYYYLINEASISHRYMQFPVERYIEYFVALYEHLHKWPELFYTRLTSQMLSIFFRRFHFRRLGNTYQDLKRIIYNEEMLSILRNMDDNYSSNQEKRTRYCLKNGKPFLLTIFIAFGKTKCLIKGKR